MGSKRTTTQDTSGTSTTQNNIPQWVSDAGKQNYDYATQVANNYQPVLRQNPVGFNANETAAQQSLIDASKVGLDLSGYNNLVNGASQGYQASTYQAPTYQAATMDGTRLNDILSQLTASQATPNIASAQAADIGNFSIGAGSVDNVRDIAAKQLQAANVDRNAIQNVDTSMASDQLAGYLKAFDPSYTQDVIDASTNDLDRARQIAQQDNAAKAAAAGAFGGSRHGITEAETNNDFARQVASNSANLRLQGFNTALGSLQTDLARKLQAQTQNQNVDWQTAAKNADFTQATNQANVANDLAAQTANQQKDYNVGIANAQMANQASVASAQLNAQAQIQNAQMKNQIALANASAKNDFSKLAYSTNAANKQLAANFGMNALTNDTAALNQAAQYNAGAQAVANQFNAGAQNAAGQFNTNAALSAAPYLLQGQQAQQQWNVNNAGLQGQVGAQQQAMDQAIQDTAYQNQLAQQNAELAKLGIRQSALGQTPYGTSSTTDYSGHSNQVTTQTPGLTDLIGAAAQGIGAWQASDRRLKRNIKPIHGPLQSLRKMHGVTYNWKATGQPAQGLIAQDVGRAIPGATIAPGGVQHYNVPAVVGLLTEAVKQLDNKVNRRRNA